eukprot:COSAG03_NODE_385_length_8317_cov_7.240813_9_plen_1299_part_00
MHLIETGHECGHHHRVFRADMVSPSSPPTSANVSNPTTSFGDGSDEGNGRWCNGSGNETTVQLANGSWVNCTSAGNRTANGTNLRLNGTLSEQQLPSTPTSGYWEDYWWDTCRLPADVPADYSISGSLWNTLAPAAPCLSLTRHVVEMLAIPDWVDAAGCSPAAMPAGGRLPPGESCTLVCADGYIGSPSQLFCPITGTPREQSTWGGATVGWQPAILALPIGELPKCELPPTVRCADLRLPSAYDTAGCNGVEPGATCTIFCRQEFDGNGTAEFGCWSENRDSAVQPQWLRTFEPDGVTPETFHPGNSSSRPPRLPTCAIPRDGCRPPETAEDPLTGLLITLSDESALATYDASNCGTGALNGGSCEVICVSPPYLFASSILSCVNGNFVGLLPDCVFPPAVACAGLQIDRPPPTSEAERDAQELAGILPGSADPMFDVSDCASVEPGAECIVSCAEGYLPTDALFATSSFACPHENRDLDQQPELLPGTQLTQCVALPPGLGSSGTRGRWFYRDDDGNCKDDPQVAPSCESILHALAVAIDPTVAAMQPSQSQESNGQSLAHLPGVVRYCQKDMRGLAGGEIRFLGQSFWQYCPSACGGCPWANQSDWTVLDHAQWCRCGNRGQCDPPYTGNCVCELGWSGAQCEICDPSICAPTPQPEPEPDDAATDAESWSTDAASWYDDEDATTTSIIRVSPPTLPQSDFRWAQLVQSLLLVIGVVGLIWGIKRGIGHLIEAKRLRKIREAREIAYRIAKAEGARKGLELMTSAFVRPWKKVVVVDEDNDESTWVQESVLTVLRVEHLPACMDGNFDAMVSAHQQEWQADWDHPRGGEWASETDRLVNLGKTETCSATPEVDGTVHFDTVTSKRRKIQVWAPGQLTLKLVDDNVFVDSIEGQATFRIDEPDEVGRTQPYSFEPLDDQTLPPERRVELMRESGGEPLFGLDGERTAIVFTVTVDAVEARDDDSYTASSTSRPGSGASSRPSSASSWGLVRSTMPSDATAESSDELLLLTSSGSFADRETQVAKRMAQLHAKAEREFGLLKPPGQPEHAAAVAPPRPLSVFKAASAGAPKPRVLPPLGARRRGAVDMTMVLAAAQDKLDAAALGDPKRKNGVLLQRLHKQSLRAHAERKRAARSRNAQTKRAQTGALAVLAANSRPSVAGRVGAVRQMGQRIKLGDPAMSLNPQVGPDSCVVAELGSSNVSSSGGGSGESSHNSDCEVLQKLGSLAAEVANEADPPPQPKLMKKLMAVEMERRREALWRAAQPKGSKASRVARKNTKATEKKSDEVHVQALRSAF